MIYAKKGLNSAILSKWNVRGACLLLLFFLGLDFPALSWQEKEDISRALKSFMQDKQIPGMQVAIAIDGEVAWTTAFGFADVEGQIPLTVHQKMRIASISKALSGVGVGKLIEQRKLNLDAPVQQYVPYFPPKKHAITVKQVAGHIAGIRNYRGDEYTSAQHFNTVQDAIGVFMNDSLEFRPGTKYMYATYNWNLMSAVMEGASKENFLTWMKREVLNPLQMFQTEAEDWRLARPQTVQYYRKNTNGEVVLAPFVDNSNKWAGGGFLSTAKDVAQMGATISSGRFLKPETFKILTTPLTLLNGENTGYGIGWAIDQKPTDGEVVGHTGSAVGGSSILAIKPAKHIVIAMICNLQGTSLVDLSYQFIDQIH